AWPRPDAVTSPQLCHCHTTCRYDGPDDDATVVTVAQVAAVQTRLATAGVAGGRPPGSASAPAKTSTGRPPGRSAGAGRSGVGTVRADRVFYTPASVRNWYMASRFTYSQAQKRCPVT